jgi:hypothetical protein
MTIHCIAFLLRSNHFLTTQVAHNNRHPLGLSRKILPVKITCFFFLMTFKKIHNFLVGLIIKDDILHGLNYDDLNLKKTLCKVTHDSQLHLVILSL